MSNFFARLLNDSSSSDEEERNTWFATAIEFERQNSQGTSFGDRINRQYRYRDRVSGHSRLLNDYFIENPVYDETLFRRRFCLSRPLFLRILHTLQHHDHYFVQRRNAANTVGLSGEQKMTAALRMLENSSFGNKKSGEQKMLTHSTSMSELERPQPSSVSNDSARGW